ncbi:MAG TPA: MFS transporter, partial [Chloroflexota bacterium]|nr:MFS transporter [Chloroflexota bacterium]
SALAADLFGRRNVGTVFGWIFFAHQAGAALAAYLGGVAREVAGDYHFAFLTAGLVAIMGGLMTVCVRRQPAPPLVMAPA